MSEETSRIEAEIDQSRHRLNDTLNAMGGKLSPGQIVDEMMGLAQGQAGQFTANLGRQVRDNPLPAVLIAAGVAVLFMQGRNSSKQRAGFDMPDQYSVMESVRARIIRRDDETDEAYEDRLHAAQADALGLRQSADETMDTFKLRVRDAVRSTGNGVSSAQHSITDAVSGAAHFAGMQAANLSRGASAATQNARSMFEDNPLVGGAVAMALGAVIGAMAPLTRMERDALSDVADKAADTAATLAQRGADAVSSQTNTRH